MTKTGFVKLSYVMLKNLLFFLQDHISCKKNDLFMFVRCSFCSAHSGLLCVTRVHGCSSDPDVSRLQPHQ